MALNGSFLRVFGCGDRSESTFLSTFSIVLRYGFGSRT